MKTITMYESMNGQRFLNELDACFADFEFLRSKLTDIAAFISVRRDMAQFLDLKQASEELFAKWQEFQKVERDTPIRHKTALRGKADGKREERANEHTDATI